jgi:hypothetical protein
MSEEQPIPEEEVPTTPPVEEEPDDTELFPDEEVPVSRKEFSALKKGVDKFFSEKGKEAPKPVSEPKEAPTPSPNDDVTELFLTGTPQAELVKDDLKTVADAKYNGSIIKAWKGEEWLHAKAEALSEQEKAKKKIQSPSNQIEGEIDFAAIEKLPDEEQGQAIKKMSDKDYKRWKEYQVRRSPKGGIITL